MSFEDQAREILKHKDNFRVDAFIDAFKPNYAGGLDEYNPLTDEIYKPPYEAAISNSELALRGLKKILNQPMYKGKQEELHEAIKIIQGALDRNEARKPKGAIPKLNKAQKYLLLHLRQEFNRCFPGQSGEYKRGTL